MKKSIIVALGSLLAFSPAFAQYDGAPMEKYQAKKEVKKEVRRDKYPHSDNVWENFDVLHINRLPSAATFLGYPSREMALKGEKEATPYYASLNGTWKFKYVPKVADRPMDFWQKGFDVSGWADIKVPGNWELQGFGYPFYVGSGYGFKRNPPLIPADNSPIGSLISSLFSIYFLLTVVRILNPIRIQQEFRVRYWQQAMLGIDVVLNEFFIMVFQRLFSNPPAQQVIPASSFQCELCRTLNILQVLQHGILAHALIQQLDIGTFAHDIDIVNRFSSSIAVVQTFCIA